MKRIIRALALTLMGAAVVAAPASARQHLKPQLNSANARRMAGNYGLNHWDPMTVLPSYSSATQWDGLDGNPSCTRFSRYRIDCVVSVTAQDYAYDYTLDDYFGYAYCVADVSVRKDSHTGRIRVTAPGFDPILDCDSTDDISLDYGRRS